MVDRAGQPLAGRCTLLDGILTPVRSTTIIVRSNGGRFAMNLQKSINYEKSY